MPNLKAFKEVLPEREFTNLESDELCTKLYGEYSPLSDTVEIRPGITMSQAEEELDNLPLQDTPCYNARVVSTGYLIHIPPEQKVQVSE